MYSTKPMQTVNDCSCKPRPRNITVSNSNLNISHRPAWSKIACSTPPSSHQQQQLLLGAPHLQRTGFQRSRVVTRASSAAAAAPLPNDASASSSSSGDLLGYIRGALFIITTYIFALPIFVVMTVLAPFIYFLDKHRRLLQHSMNNIWAKISSFWYFPVQIEGLENLPDPQTAAVYVANHQSFLDIFSLFFLDRPFKFISKASIFYIPIVGWSMFLTGHVMLNRMDRRSQLDCLRQCGELLRNGASVLFFPEGTRSLDLKLQEFKKGAFSVAVKAGVPVVPISIMGTGNMMPSGKETMLRPGGVKIVVHKPIPCKGRNADDVCAEARQAVASGLPAELVA